MKISEMKVTLVDNMGSDLSVVNAARVSFAKESEWERQHWDPITNKEDVDLRELAEKDVKLINYLARHNHWTPFAHAFASFRIKAPIFVARQLVKHQVGLAWNEESRRYIDSQPEFWFPKEWRGRPVNAKQGSSGVIDGYVPDNEWCKNCLSMYTIMLEKGIAPEQARMVLPQNTMTEWIWSGSLAAFARVCKLRLDPHAQQETQEVAQRIADEMIKLFPVSFKVLLEN
jgi:thymidylate synthase (FAD)